MTESTPTQPADPATGDHTPTENPGRTPHPEDPAEGSTEAAAESGLDPENRITGI